MKIWNSRPPLTQAANRQDLTDTQSQIMTLIIQNEEV